MTDDSSLRPVGSGFDPIDFLDRAVQHPSHEDVEPMRTFLCETLEAHGVDARVDDAGNVLASRGGGSADGNGRAAADGEAKYAETTHVVLNTHIDTVPPHVPFERVETAPSGESGLDGTPASTGDEAVIRGRGSCDAKGPLAAMLSAFLAVDPGDGRLTLAITPDEEVRSTGAHALVTREDSPVRDADAVIVGEPTGLDVCTAAKGRFQGTITLSGASAHAAEPDSGVNAVAALESVLVALETFDARDDAPPTHPQLGGATLTPTVVEGGEATNQVPAASRLTIDRRSVPPETAEGFRRSLLEHLESAVPTAVDVAFDFEERPTPFLEAWETDADNPLVGTLAAAAGGESDIGGGVRPFTAATEAAYFAERAPTVVFGPGVLADDEGAVAHSPREYVRVADVRAAAAALERTLADLVGRNRPA